MSIPCVFVRHETEPIACEGDDAMLVPTVLRIKCRSRVYDVCQALARRYGGYWQCWTIGEA